MTDTTASSASPDPQGIHSPAPAQNGGEDSFKQPLTQTGDGWEPVTLPGQLPLADSFEPLENDADGPSIDAQQKELMPESADTEGAVAPAEPAPENLVQLIQDLNQCNDALLLRVTELEDDLERSQVALQAEIERTQAQPGGLPADAIPGPVQQQIAQLLSELDIANDGLRRTTIHNETLHAELESAQQRVAQLERECTLLQQRFSEKHTALHQAEETCRDLKARLHRQQRYTLQFKAALEKCLNMAPGSSPASAAAHTQGQLLDTAALEAPGQPVAMPRSQQIQPWSAGPGTTTNNPSLTHLLRGLRGAGPSPVPAPTAPPTDLPRAPEPRLDLAEQLAALTPSSAPTPDLPPYQAPVAPSPAQSTSDPWLENTSAVEPAASPFTEPSPWGEPIAPATPPPAEEAEPQRPQPPLTQAPIAHQTPAAPAPSPAPSAATFSSSVAASASTPALPAYLTASGKASPSPLVYPLRSQKKIKSIAAVELPSFGRAVRRR